MRSFCFFFSFPASASFCFTPPPPLHPPTPPFSPLHQCQIPSLTCVPLARRLAAFPSLGRTSDRAEGGRRRGASKDKYDWQQTGWALLQSHHWVGGGMRRGGVAVVAWEPNRPHDYKLAWVWSKCHPGYFHFCLSSEPPPPPPNDLHAGFRGVSSFFAAGQHQFFFFLELRELKDWSSTKKEKLNFNIQPRPDDCLFSSGRNLEFGGLGIIIWCWWTVLERFIWISVRLLRLLCQIYQFRAF